MEHSLLTAIQAVLVPDLTDGTEIDVHHASFILVIEKEVLHHA